MPRTPHPPAAATRRRPHGGAAGPPSAAELAVSTALYRVWELIDRLIESPIDAGVYEELRAYLDGDADVAVQAYEELRGLGLSHLQMRMRHLQLGLQLVSEQDDPRVLGA